jgi:hypothetical protein
MPAEETLFLISTMSRDDLENTHPLVKSETRVLSQGMKRPESEADRWTPYTAEVKKVYSYISAP